MGIDSYGTLRTLIIFIMHGVYNRVDHLAMVVIFVMIPTEMNSPSSYYGSNGAYWIGIEGITHNGDWLVSNSYG